MSAWKDFVTAALLGTEQGGAMPPLPAALADALGPTEALGPEARFLTRAGAVALWRRTGWQAGRPGVTLRSPAPPETAPVVNPASGGHLRAMLGGHCADALPEWLGQVARRGKRVPPELLPALLEWARTNRTQRPLAAAAGGERVHWLATLNPAWNFAADDAPEHWETGGREQRVAILRQWRATEPALAREQLAAVWSTEPADARTTLLETWTEGLTEADEEFLERALDDRSKEVRQVAADLLSRLPGSAYVARMLARADGLLSFHRGGLLSRSALEVHLPPDPDAAARRDRVDPKFYEGQKVFGEKAVLLILILRAVPLRHWTERFRQTPAELLQALKKSEFADAVATGWKFAAVRQKDAAWAEALLDGPVQPGDVLMYRYSLYEALAESERMARLTASVRGLLEGEYKYEAWLAFTAQLWVHQGYYPDALGRELLTSLRRLAAATNERAPAYHVWNAAKTFVLPISPALLPEATQGWPAGDPRVSPVIELLTFRLEMLTALAQP